MPRSAGRRRVLVASLALFVFGALALPLDGAPRAAPSPHSALLGHRGLIRRGDRGDVVRALQEVLGLLGYDTRADGVFGDATMASVQKFQKDHGLQADGIVGAATLSALSLEYDKKYPPERHTVKPGETLSSIAERYGLAVDFLSRVNRLTDPNTIYVGQSLYLKGDASWSKEPEEPDQSADTPATQDLPAPPAPPIPTKRVCLSFDDGPDVSTTRQILSILDRYGVKATFFLIGEKAVRNPDLVLEIASSGHVIGVHGYEHKPLSGLSASEVRKDLKKCQDALAALTGVTPHLYRPPGGSLDRTQIEEAERLGLTTLMWTNIGGADLGAGSSEEVATRVVAWAKDGGIILLHEGLQTTVEALPAIIEALARMGFGFQNVSPTAPALER